MNQYPVVKRAEITTTLLGGFIVEHKCPHCKAELKSKPDEIGKPDECPHCGGVFMVSQTYLAEIKQKQKLERAIREKEQADKEETRQQKQAEKAAEKERLRQEKEERERETQLNAQASQQRNKRKEFPKSRCMTCEATISAKASSCPHCGAPLGSGPPLSAAGLAVLGFVVTGYFLFVFDVSVSSGTHLGPDRVSNLGLMNDRICGVITGLAMITWSFILSGKGR